jgi:putative membrane protein
VVGAAVTAAVVTLDVALFSWHWDIDFLGLFTFLWLACTAVGWLLLGTVRTFGLVLGALLGVVALFLQQPISGAAYPPAFAPEIVRWAEPIAPLRYFVEGIRDVLIGGSTLPDMAIALVVIALVGLVLVVIGSARLELLARRHPPAAAPVAS